MNLDTNPENQRYSYSNFMNLTTDQENPDSSKKFTQFCNYSSLNRNPENQGSSRVSMSAETLFHKSIINP